MLIVTLGIPVFRGTEDFPYKKATNAYFVGQEILDLLGCHKVPPQDVTLNRSIFHKEDSHESR